jgi:hypothetical protein
MTKRSATDMWSQVAHHFAVERARVSRGSRLEMRASIKRLRHLLGRAVSVANQPVNPTSGSARVARCRPVAARVSRTG